jgi:hypothetical protein
VSKCKGKAHIIFCNDDPKAVLVGRLSDANAFKVKMRGEEFERLYLGGRFGEKCRWSAKQDHNDLRYWHIHTVDLIPPPDHSFETKTKHSMSDIPSVGRR